MSRYAFITAAFLTPTLLLANDPSVDYSRDILPILSDNCFECHGPDEETREADLRLDIAEHAYADRDGAIAIVPGDPDASDLVFLTQSDVEDEQMPPPKSKKILSETEKKLLEQWIEQGGEYESHWAFSRPQKDTPPTTAKHPIDAFIRQRLKEAGLKSSSSASAHTLIRRIHLDLIGLPPSPQEIEAFVKAYRSNAQSSIGTLIDELMTRPAFGEKWARQWLDIA
ncbi:MAG: DUF1549 domain-containing protein, partial [Opitutales bacterium]|nr:DUF1549 domain-containing protein [Opitutales bacterium]